MSSSLSKSLGLCTSFAMAADVVNSSSKQGIVTALASSDDGERTAKAASLRRTLSADLSSKTWSVKGIAGELADPSLSDGVAGVEGRGGGRVGKQGEQNRPSQIDIWTSILSQKNDSAGSSLPPPYVHPLVKRSTSLSERSLEICTESLGSETGADGFGFSSGDEDNKDGEKQPPLVVEDTKVVVAQVDASEEIQVVKYNCAYHNKKTTGPRSFPPPLPSLSRSDGASVHMQSRRENGRLVLSAVSIPTQNNFHAKRQDGRLLLTYVNDGKSDLQDVKEKDTIDETANKLGIEEETMKDDIAEDEPEDGAGEEELEEVNTKTRMKIETPMVTASGVMNVHRPTFLVNKLIRLTNRNTSIWTNKFNEVVKVELQADEEAIDQLDPKALTQSLTPPPCLTCLIPPKEPSTTSAMAAAASTFNAYEYCWRRKPSSATTTTVFKTSHSDPPPSVPISSNNNMFILTKSSKTPSWNNNKDQPMTTNFVVVKGNKGEEEYMVPYFKGCKDTKKSLLFRGPYCIATS